MTSSPGKRRIGVIGIGAMGMAMARNLARRGYPLAVRDVRSEAEDQARAEGMSPCPTPGALIERCDMAAVVVVNAAQIDQVLNGPGGLLQADLRGRTVLLCSTIAPHDTVRIAGQLAACGAETIDGPISGGPARAEAGTMSMMLAARDSVLATWDDVLADLADKRFRLGENIGDAAKAKLVNNLLAGINLVASAEALALGMKVGLDPDTLFHLISGSSGASWVFQDRMARVLQNDFRPRAAAPILTKDIGLALDLARSVDHDAPLGHVALERFRETLAHGWGELDDAAVFKTYQP